MSGPGDREVELQRKLEQHSYLWTSGEWRLSRTTRVQYRIYLVFPDGAATTQELVAIRGLLPHFAALPVTQLKEEVGGRLDYFAGEFGSMSAHRFIGKAEAKGLKIRTEGATEVGYLPVDIHGTALIIEDDGLAEMVTARMLREGVPVVDSGIEIDD